MNDRLPAVTVPCSHIADYYDMLYSSKQCLAYNILRHGYRQWAKGTATHPVNNLYERFRHGE